MWNKDQDSSYSFFASVQLGRKKYPSLFSFMALAVSSPLKWGILEILLSSYVTQHFIGNKRNDPTFTYVRFSTHSTAFHKLSWNCCQYLLLIFTFDVKLWLPKADTQRVSFITQIKTVHSTIKCVCGKFFWLRELK